MGKKCVYERCPYDGTYLEEDHVSCSNTTHCAWYKAPISNAKKIQSLDISHLGGFLRRITDCNQCPASKDKRCFKHEDKCDNNWATWLQQEAEDE